jgi:hypothetical protein
MSAYLAAWVATCTVAMFVAVRDREQLRTQYAGYARFLLRPWKVVTFAISGSGLVLVAPYTGDPTWDWFDASFMAVATYLTAPWSVGVLYRAARGRAPASHAFLAACAWMFSASWSYDLYLLLRDGYYPVTWDANIAASSVLYACAGLLWNLEHVPGRGVIFGFMHDDWPRLRTSGTFGKVGWAALPFMLIAGICVLWFVHDFLTTH